MTVAVYKSTDPAFAALPMNGVAGSLVAILDVILPARGWAIEFTGTNKRVYRAATGNRHRLRVDDTGTTSARVVGYETMTDVDTGTGDFPTAVQFSGGHHIYKSSTANSTARPWMCLASSTAFYLFIASSGTTFGAAATANEGMFFFGDLIPYLSGDAFATLLCGNSSAATNGCNLFGCNGDSNQAGGRWVARSYTQIGASVACGQRARAFATTLQASPGVLGSASYGWGRTYPDPMTGGLLMAPVEVSEGLANGRGKMPGMWCPLHSQPGAHYDTFSGTGALAGKTFIIVDGFFGSLAGCAIFETSDGW